LQDCPLLKKELSLFGQFFFYFASFNYNLEVFDLYHSKRNQEPVQQEQTSVWTCSKESCSCWMRESFAFDENPICPLCSSSMVKDTKMLPILSQN